MVTPTCSLLPTMYVSTNCCMFSNKVEVYRGDFEQERKDRQEAAGRYEAKEEEHIDEIQKLTEKNLRQADEVERTFCMRKLSGFTTCTYAVFSPDILRHVSPTCLHF